MVKVMKEKIYKCRECGFESNTPLGWHKAERMVHCGDCMSIKTVFSFISEDWGNVWFGGIWLDFGYNYIYRVKGHVLEDFMVCLTTKARERVCEYIEEYWNNEKEYLQIEAWDKHPSTDIYISDKNMIGRVFDKGKDGVFRETKHLKTLLNKIKTNGMIVLTKKGSSPYRVYWPYRIDFMGGAHLASKKDGFSEYELELFLEKYERFLNNGSVSLINMEAGNEVFDLIKNRIFDERLSNSLKKIQGIKDQTFEDVSRVAEEDIISELLFFEEYSESVYLPATKEYNTSKLPKKNRSYSAFSSIKNMAINRR